MDPLGSTMQVMFSAQGAFHLWPSNLAWYSLAWRLKQFDTPSKQPQGGPCSPLGLNTDGPFLLENCSLILRRMLSWVWVFLLPCSSPQSMKQYPQISQGLSPSVSFSYLSKNTPHSSESKSLRQYFQQRGKISGSTISFFMMYSIVLCSRVVKLITPFPTKIAIRLTRSAAFCFRLYLSIRTARSGMYFPAQDSPAMKNLFFLYSGYLEKKSRRALKESIAVEASVQLKVLSRLQEYPTPAGDSKKSIWEALCQEQGFSFSLSPTLQFCPSSRQQGPTSSKKPKMRANLPKSEEQPGPPLSQSATGSELLAPLADSTKAQCSHLLSLPVPKYPEQTLVLKSSAQP